MKSSALVSASPCALALLSVGLWSSNAGAQPVGRESLPTIPAPAVQEVAPLGVKTATDPTAVGVAPIGIGAVALVAVNASAYRVAAASKKLRAGEMTPQQAWDSKALDVDDLIYFLEKGIDSWGGFFWEKDPELRRSLTTLLVEHGSERLKKPEELSPIVRLWLADYYGSIQSNRAVVLSESILSEIKEPIQGENPLVFQAVERIAWYYRDQGQFEKSSKAWLRIPTLLTSQGWYQADAFVEAAQMYEQDGRLEKAEQTYAQAPITRTEWADGLVVTNWAQLLIKLGRYEEARRMLQASAAKLNLGDITTPIILGCLGDSYYFAGDLSQAASYARQAIDSYQSLQNSQHSIYLDAVLPINQERLRWIERWPEEPIICAPRHLNVVRSYIQVDQETEEVTRKFYVRTLHHMELHVSSNNKMITAHVVENKLHQPFKRHFYQQEVLVSIAPEVTREGAQAVITVSSPDVPTYKVEVPILIKKQDDVTTDR